MLYNRQVLRKVHSDGLKCGYRSENKRISL